MLNVSKVSMCVLLASSCKFPAPESSCDDVRALKLALLLYMGLEFGIPRRCQWGGPGELL